MNYNSTLPKNLEQMRSSIQRILLEDWDPHEVFKRPEAHRAYDAWIAPLYDLLQGDPSEEQIMEWLHEREKETMCFPSLGKERLRRVARELKKTVTHPEP